MTEPCFYGGDFFVTPTFLLLLLPTDISLSVENLRKEETSFYVVIK